jgi:hypothetical protein
MSQSFNLDHSNTFGAVTNYGTVFLETNNGGMTVNGLAAGQARLTFTINPNNGQFSGILGVDKFAFNSAAGLSPPITVTPPSGWSLGNGSMDGFGTYTAHYDNPASTDTSFAFLIDHLGSNATVANFESNNGGHAHYYFAAHVRFTSTGGSTFIAGCNDPMTPAPEPSAVVMLATGAGILGLVGGVRRFRRAAV